MSTPDENDVDKLAAMFNNLHITTPNGSDVDKLTEAFNSLHVTTPSEKKLDAMLTDFENRTATDPHHPGQNLRKLLDDSPYLKDRFLDSAGHGHLERFDVLPADAHAGGTYDSGSKSIRLPQNRLDAAGVSKQNAADMVFVMGHEIQHSFNSSVTADATKKFLDDVNKTAKGTGPHDYTAAIDTLIQTNRRDEASANIGGFNALASWVQENNPKATLEDFYKARPERMGDFIERTGERPHFNYALRPGLSVDKHLHMDTSKENVEAMGKYYFDKTPTPNNGLGPKGNQNYHNYYGNWALNCIDSVEKSARAAHTSDPKYVEPKVDINLRKVGLDQTQLDTPLRYTDTSPDKRKGPATPFDESQPPAKRAKGPFGDPALNDALHAMRSGSDAHVTQAAQQVQHSPDGQRLTQTARSLLAEQPKQEAPAQTQASAHPPSR